jgi:hypothetical protein
LLLALAALCIPLFSQTSQPSATDPRDQTVILRIIVVSSLEHVQRIVEQLNQKQDFAAIAMRESIDSTASNGGYIGKVMLSALRPELRDALIGVTPGKISPIVKAPLGFAVLKVEAEEDPAKSDGPDQARNPATASTGSVKVAFSLGGFGESLLGLSNFDKATGWDRDPRKVCEVHKLSLAAEKKSLNHLLYSPDPKARASLERIDLFNAHFSLGEIYAYTGDMEHAVVEYKEAHQMAAADAPQAMP